MFLLNWIDDEYEIIKNEPVFKKYFNGIDIEEIEGAFYILNANKGIDVVLSEKYLVRSIHLFSGDDDIKEYKGEIPYGVAFSMSQDTIKVVLGEPKERGGGYTDISGHVPRWDKFLFEGYSLHLQYSENLEKIDLITIASLSLEAYFNIGLQ